MQAKLFTALLMAALAGQAQPAQIQSKHVPSPALLGGKIGPLDGSNTLQLSISLPLRNKQGLDDAVAQIYDPASPNFRHYLSTAEFIQRFSPAHQDYQALTAYCQRHGLEIQRTHENRVLLDVSGKVENIEDAFHPRLARYQEAGQDRWIYAPEAEPTTDLSIPVLHIGGLDNAAPARPLNHKRNIQETVAHPEAGTGPIGLYMGKDFRNAYAPGVKLTGAGQSVALVEFDSYYTSDVSNYMHQAGLTPVPIQTVLLDQYSGIPGPNDSEVALDIEVAASMAPGLQSIVCYTGGPSAYGNDMLSAIADSNTCKQVSCSWTWGVIQDPTTEQILEQMAAQGQSFFAASGDNFSYPDRQTEAPTDNPYAVSVGGTTLTTSSSQAWLGEVAWNDSAETNGTGGGISAYNIPWWQTNLATAANGASATMRNIPDVACVANEVYSIADDGIEYNNEGTSIAAPLWAGFAALINQDEAGLGQAPVGFLNPALYALGRTNEASSFHDVTSGNNTNCANPTGFYCQPGYDLCTGWGTPNGSNTINTIAGLFLLPPQITGMTLEANGAISISVANTLGRAYTVQYSSNLESWANLCTVSFDINGAAVIDTNTAASRFYRLRQN
jgi:subtilase family serine protease